MTSELVIKDDTALPDSLGTRTFGALNCHVTAYPKAVML